MFRVLTIVAFLSAQIMPYQVNAADNVVNEFEKSAKEVQEKVTAEKAAVEKSEKINQLRNSIRDDTIILAARAEELETLAEQIPNVQENIIEETASNLKIEEEENGSNEVSGVAAIIAVASGVVYALTQFDIPKALRQIRASRVNAEPTVTSQTSQTAAEPITVKTKPNVVSRALGNIYGNRALAKGAATVGVLAAIVAGAAYLSSHAFSVEEISTVETVENQYLSQLVSDGTIMHLTEDEIEEVLTERYKEDPAFREAVLAEVRAIVADSEKLHASIAAKKQEIEKIASSD